MTYFFLLWCILGKKTLDQFFKLNLYEFVLSLNSPGAIHPILQIELVHAKQQAQQEFKNICPPNSSDTLCLCFCLYPSSMITICIRVTAFAYFVCGTLCSDMKNSANCDLGGNSDKDSCLADPRYPRTLGWHTSPGHHCRSGETQHKPSYTVRTLSHCLNFYVVFYS